MIAAYRQFSVLELGKTFAALTVSDITRRTSPDPNDYAETGQFMIHLISSGHLKATVSQPSDDPAGWIVRFSDSSTSPLADAEDRQYEALVRHTQNIKYINENIREIDRKLSLSKDYLAEVKKGKKNKNGDGGIDEGGSWMNHGDLFDQDEDMMGDM